MNPALRTDALVIGAGAGGVTVAAAYVVPAIRDLLRRALRWTLHNHKWQWLLPVLVLELIRHRPTIPQKFIEVILAIGVLVLVRRYKVGALAALIVVSPFQVFILAYLFKHHVPASIVRPLGFWKEAIVAGLIGSGLYDLAHSRRHLDALDWLALAYVTLATAYLFLPTLFVGNVPGAIHTFYSRELGWRGDVLYVALLFGCRHIDIPRQAADRLLRILLGSITAVAATGLFEFSAPATWNRLAVYTFGVTHYKLVILGLHQSSSFRLDDVRVYDTFAGQRVLRVGTVELDYIVAGFLLALGVTIAATLIARGDARRWVYIAFPVVTLAMLLTQTRSAILAGFVGVVLALGPKVGGSVAHRINFTILLALVALLSVPLVLSSGAGSRLNGADTSSNAAHQGAVSTGLKVLEHHPLGVGLSTGAGAGQESAAKQLQGPSGFSVAENQYLQIGVELGFLGLALWVALLILAIRRLKPGEGPGSACRAAMRNGVAGMLPGFYFLIPLASLGLSWPMYALTGIALGSAADPRQPTATSPLAVEDSIEAP